MKTKFAKDLADNIRMDKQSIVIDHKYTYAQAMKEDSTEQTLCGQLMTEKFLVNHWLRLLIDDVIRLRKSYVNSNTKEFISNIKSRYPDPGDAWAFDSHLEILKYLEPQGNDEETIWDQWYLAWLRDAFNTVEFMLRSDHESLLKLITY